MFITIHNDNTHTGKKAHKLILKLLSTNRRTLSNTHQPSVQSLETQNCSYHYERIAILDFTIIFNLSYDTEFSSYVIIFMKLCVSLARYP